MKTAMQELIDWVECTNDNNVYDILDMAKELLEKEKEQIIQHIDRYCDLYGHKTVGEQLYNAWYIEPKLKPISNEIK